MIDQQFSMWKRILFRGRKGRCQCLKFSEIVPKAFSPITRSKSQKAFIGKKHHRGRYWWHEGPITKRSQGVVRSYLFEENMTCFPTCLIINVKYYLYHKFWKPNTFWRWDYEFFIFSSLFFLFVTQIKLDISWSVTTPFCMQKIPKEYIEKQFKCVYRNLLKRMGKGY